MLCASFSIIFANITITEPQHTDMRCVIVVGIAVAGTKAFSVSLETTIMSLMVKIRIS